MSTDDNFGKVLVIGGSGHHGRRGGRMFMCMLYCGLTFQGCANWSFPLNGHLFLLVLCQCYLGMILGIIRLPLGIRQTRH